MNTNRNSGTKKITEATSSMNPLSLEGGARGGLHVGNRGNNPNNNTENENKKATPAAASSPTGKDDDAVSSMRSNTAAPNLFTPTAAMSNLILSSSSSSSPVTSLSTTTGIVTENGPCQNNKNEEAAAPSSSRTTLSGVVETGIAAAETSSTTTPRYEREECPICFHVLPHAIDEIVYQTCCGRKICNGCIIGRERAELKETGKIIEGVTPEEKQFFLIRLFWSNLCPFCRHPGPENDEEQLQLIYDRIEKRDERDYTSALFTLGVAYSHGWWGLPQNIEKGKELFQEAYDLDHPIAAFELYLHHRSQYPDQKEKQMEFLRRGETLGNLECIEVLRGLAIHAAGLSSMVPKNYKEVTRLVTKAASLGGDTRNLMIAYQKKQISKDYFATILRAHQAANDEMKTVQRGFAMRYKTFLDEN